ncbi:unnamed protein product [Prorocentrum cordatum]|uniref:Uncharacterized protein n=1 Tax=Prorocentrum cordatum TaxID=2364126 RepID=A0ABN9TKW2_9DINO|nr:unnamed protein product [Polarella glacialis]
MTRVRKKPAGVPAPRPPTHAVTPLGKCACCDYPLASAGETTAVCVDLTGARDATHGLARCCNERCRASRHINALSVERMNDRMSFASAGRAWAARYLQCREKLLARGFASSRSAGRPCEEIFGADGAAADFRKQRSDSILYAMTDRVKELVADGHHKVRALCSRSRGAPPALDSADGDRRTCGRPIVADPTAQRIVAVREQRRSDNNDALRARLGESTVGPAVRDKGFDFFTEEQYRELAALVGSVAAREPVSVVVGSRDLDQCKGHLADIGGVEYVTLEHVNWWLRDTGPALVLRGLPGGAGEALGAVRWEFHGYGSPKGSSARRASEGRKEFYSWYYPRGEGPEAGPLWTWSWHEAWPRSPARSPSGSPRAWPSRAAPWSATARARASSWRRSCRAPASGGSSWRPSSSGSWA